MSEMFLSSQLNNIDWSDLSDNDKLAALRNANTTINRLQFIGRKKDELQEDAFPRIIGKKPHEEILEMPDNVRLAIGQYCYDFINVMTSESYDKIKSGIKSATIGPISETYDIYNIDRYRNQYMVYLAGLIYRGN